MSQNIFFSVWQKRKLSYKGFEEREGELMMAEFYLLFLAFRSSSQTFYCNGTSRTAWDQLDITLCYFSNSLSRRKTTAVLSYGTDQDRIDTAAFISRR